MNLLDLFVSVSRCGERRWGGEPPFTYLCAVGTEAGPRRYNFYLAFGILPTIERLMSIPSTWKCGMIDIETR